MLNVLPRATLAEADRKHVFSSAHAGTAFVSPEGAGATNTQRLFQCAAGTLHVIFELRLFPWTKGQYKKIMAPKAKEKGTTATTTKRAVVYGSCNGKVP